jgi:type II secretion system protein N
VKRLLIALAVLVIFIFGLWFIAIPESLLLDLIKGSLKDSGIVIDVISPQKGLFYNFKAEGLVLKKSDKELLVIHNMSGRLNFPSLLKLRTALELNGEIGDGRVYGRTDLFGGKNHSEIFIENANIEAMSFFPLVGIEGTGLLSGELKMDRDNGNATFSIRDADFKPATFGGIPVPLDVFHTAQCAITIAGDTMNITSLVMEGDGIYARIRGKIASGKPDLVLELMPEKSLKEKDFIFPLFEKYKVSPGYYAIPIRDSAGV